MDYIKKAASIHFGLTLKNVKVLSYHIVKANQIKYPPTKDSEEMAEKYWQQLFRTRFKNEIPLQKTEVASWVRSSSFNIDEIGLPNVHVPLKILASTGIKQVVSLMSANRQITATMIANCNAGGDLFLQRLYYQESISFL